jgi:hypothetical protein
MNAFTAHSCPEPELPLRDMGPLSARPIKDILHDLVGAFDRLSVEVERSIQVRDAWDARINAQREARNG